MNQEEQDAVDARRWRAVRTRYPYSLCRLATGGSRSYSSTKAPELVDAWADRAADEVEAFDADNLMSGADDARS